MSPDLWQLLNQYFENSLEDLLCDAKHECYYLAIIDSDLIEIIGNNFQYSDWLVRQKTNNLFCLRYHKEITHHAHDDAFIIKLME